MRLLLFFIGLAFVICLPFLFWGEAFERWFAGEGLRAWMTSQGAGLVWLLAILLLVGDLFLPVPATAVMSGLGYFYGTLTGGVIGASGSFLSGALAYGLCRKFGERVAARLMGPSDLERGQRLFATQAGGWLVALSRWMPLLPEVVACMAGLTRMPGRKFFSALACGCLPMGFVFAWIGSQGEARPGLAIGLSIVVPALLYAAALLLKRRMERPQPAMTERDS